MARNIIDKIKFQISTKLLGKEFSSQKYWELRYSNAGDSGIGSYGKMAEDKAKFINLLIDKYSLESCLEYGSGDGHNLQFYNFKKYLGVDVSKTAIDLCLKQYGADKTKAFALYDQNYFHHMNQFLEVDVTLSSEVLFHLVEQSVYDKYLDNLFSTAKKGVIIISTDSNDNEGIPPHIHHRQFSKDVSSKFPQFKREELNLGAEYDEYKNYFHYYSRN
tara:strand:- start:36336 stop:36989 length:654 start_codon:yes stop_codon:yes gene_type:complete